MKTKRPEEKWQVWIKGRGWITDRPKVKSDVIGYIYEEEIHCVKCAEKRAKRGGFIFGKRKNETTLDGLVDNNWCPVVAIHPWDGIEGKCGDCRKEIK